MAMPSFSPRYEQAELLQGEIHPRESHLIKEDKVLKMSDMALRLFTTPPAVQYHYQAKTVPIPLIRRNFMVFQPRLFSSTKSSVRCGTIRCKATGESSQSSFNPTVYQGIYGPWTVDSSDVREVLHCGYEPLECFLRLTDSAFSFCRFLTPITFSKNPMAPFDISYLLKALWEC